MCVLQPFGTGVDVFKDHPKLMAWRERVKEELSEKLFEEAHEGIVKSSSLPQMLKSSISFNKLKPTLQKLFH